MIAVDDKDVTADSNAANAIDAKPTTLWQINEGALPHSITVDMGRELPVAGFSYLPPQGRNASGVIDTYRFETSTDGKTWTIDVDQGRFGNIRNNPVLQEVPFKQVPSRYFRFTVLQGANGNSAVSVAEITVLPSRKE